MAARARRSRGRERIGGGMRPRVTRPRTTARGESGRRRRRLRAAAPARARRRARRRAPQRPRPPSCRPPAPPRRAEVAEVARLAQRAIEGADLLRGSRSRPSCSKRKCGDRSSATMASRVKSSSRRARGPDRRPRRSARPPAAARRTSDTGCPAAPNVSRREIQIRQRPLEHDRRAVERSDVTRRSSTSLDLPGDGDELLFAIAVREPQLIRPPPAGVTSIGRTRDVGRRDRTRLDLLETGPPVVQALVKAGAEHRLGADTMSMRLEARQCARADRNRRRTGRPDRQSSRPTVTMTWRIGAAAGSAIRRSRSVCSSQACDSTTRRS